MVNAIDTKVALHFLFFMLARITGIQLSVLPQDNKQACQLVLLPFLFEQSSKQESSENHFLKSFGMTQLEK